MDADALRQAAEKGEAYTNPNAKEYEPVYSQEGPVISLTLDRKQAWILSVLLQPYKNAEEGDWEMVRAAEHTRHAIAEAMGYE